jgi:serine/threonine protein kinase
LSAAALAPRQGRRIGRFVLREELGRGAQATVWLAHDERLERDVALKLLSPEADTLAVTQWLHEARAVSRLSHPNIVPVFEADEHAGQPYLVFELVRGRTLADALRRNGAMAQRDAGNLMVGVLDALRTAHEQGIIHRDLKPSNILLDAQGRARVMDFGIAARVAEAGDGRIVGTPGYMSPEAAQGLPPTPQMDVFSAGMLLAEMLTGKGLVRERDPYTALHRVINEDLQLPNSVQADDGLRAVVQRAIARDPALRFGTVAAMRDALQAWLEPQAAGEGGSATSSGTLDFLLRRMRHKSDFPTLSDSVVRIQRIATSDKENLNSLANEILKDVALTNKLLRMVNTVHFSSAGGGSISTVSRAVALVGFAGIRNMALSLVLIEHMKDKGHANRLREEFLRSLMAGQLASELTPLARDSEEAFLGAMFHNLGRLLTEYYFAEEAQAIREQVQSASARPDAAAPSVDSIAERVLGIGFEQLGLGVARSWGLPDSLQRCMRKTSGDPPTRAVDRGTERLRWLASAANEIAEVVLRVDPEHAAAKIDGIGERYCKALGISLKDLQSAVVTARGKLAQLAPAMGLQMPAATAKRLQNKGADAPAARDAVDSLSPYELHATIPLSGQGLGTVSEAATMVISPERIAEVLAAGIQDITNTMAGEHFRLNEVLRMILETMYRAMGFQRVIFCLREPKAEALLGRFGLGAQADVVSRAFRIDLKRNATPDLLAAVCIKNADTLIADARAPHIAQRLPAWYCKEVNAASFLLLPMVMKGAPFALIYGDKSESGALALSERELALLRTLRNQAVMAFRQAS